MLAFSAEHVEGRIDAFLDEFGEILRSLSDEDFKSQVNKSFVMCYLPIHHCKYLAEGFKWGSPGKARGKSSEPDHHWFSTCT